MVYFTGIMVSEKFAPTVLIIDAFGKVSKTQVSYLKGKYLTNTAEEEYAITQL